MKQRIIKGLERLAIRALAAFTECSQWSVTPVEGNLTWGLFRRGTDTVPRQACRQNSHAYKNKQINKYFFQRIKIGEGARKVVASVAQGCSAQLSNLEVRDGGT